MSINDTDQIISAESGGNPTATNPNSSASGPGQFIDSTWLSTVKQHAPDLAQGKSDAEILALKNDPQLATRPENIALAHQMTGAYAADNQAHLAKNGVPVTPGTTYLAHFAGPQGAVKVLQADPNTPVSDILGAAAVKANSFLNGMTAQQLQAWAAKKMGAQSPVSPVSASPAAPVLPAAPPASPPIFAKRPQTPLQQIAAVTAGGSGYQPFKDAAMPAAPIFAPQSPPVDLSRLRAMLAQQSPIFANRG